MPLVFRVIFNERVIANGDEEVIKIPVDLFKKVFHRLL